MCPQKYGKIFFSYNKTTDKIYFLKILEDTDDVEKKREEDKTACTNAWRKKYFFNCKVEKGYPAYLYLIFNPGLASYLTRIYLSISV